MNVLGMHEALWQWLSGEDVLDVLIYLYDTY